MANNNNNTEDEYVPPGKILAFLPDSRNEDPLGEQHDVGTTPGFHGDVEKALASIQAPVLYMPSETDLYFPVGDARYEAQFIPHCTLLPIPSLWGHPAGAGASPEDGKFLNEHIARFLQAKSLHK